MGGIACSANWTSTTGPITWTILPVFIGSERGWVSWKVVLGGAERSGCDLEDFLGDGRLAGLVVLEGEVAQQLGRVVLRGLHGDHAGAVLRGLPRERKLVDLVVHVVGKKGVQDGGR